MIHAAAILAALTMSAGQHAIVHDIGPGTVLGPCKRISADAIICGYATPGVNVGIEDPEDETTWASWAIAKRDRRRGPVRVINPNAQFVEGVQVR